MKAKGITVIILTVLDAVLTVIGLQLGIITEGNPIFRGAMHTYPLITAALVCVCTAGLMWLVCKYGSTFRSTRALMTVLCAAKSLIIVSHIGWVLLAAGVMWC